MSPEDPDVISVDVGRSLLIGYGDEHVGGFTLSLKQRLRFLCSGRVEVWALDGGGTRFALHAPRFRELPLRILDHLLREPEV